MPMSTTQQAQSQTIEFKRLTPHPESGAYSLDAVAELFELPFNDLVFRAQTVHRQHFDANKVQLSTLLSVKTGGCSEDCGYCSQSARYDTGLEKEVLMNADEVIDVARIAKENGASRFCMGAAWRGPKTKDLVEVKKMIAGVKALGLETCATFGMLKEGQAEELRDSGLDYYNHNLDTSPENYANIVTSHSYQDRLDTLGKVRKAGLNVCSGGIVGLGETRLDRVGLIAQLANLEPQPDSVPINNLVKIEGTPLEEGEAIDWTEFVRMIAVARITMPKSFVRLSAGRQQMPEAMQALCFMAGANSIFYGDKLLTTGNPDVSRDRNLFAKLNIQPL
jgi:biotin synthase